MSENLSRTLITNTGLPQDIVEKEFHALLEKFGKNPECLTMDELREVMADYLQLVFLELKEDISA